MIANFLIDSRYGGPHLYLNSLKKNIYKIKSLDYYQDKTNNNLNLSDLKRLNKFLFFLDVLINIILIYKNFSKQKKFKIFCVFTIYNIAPIIAAFFLKKKIFWFILEKPKKFSYLIFKFLNFFIKMDIIVISESLAKQLKIQKYSIYFPDIDFKFWNKFPNKNYIHKNKKIILTCACNLNKTKNHLQLLEFLNKFDKKIELNFIGRKLNTQKRYFHKLKEKSSELNKKKNIKINFLGKRDRNFIRLFYKKTDIYILPSLSEGLSVSLTEAMSAGCICLVSKNSNHSNVINKKNGFVFQLNQNSFLEEFEKILNLKIEEYFSIRKNGFKTVKNLIEKGNRLNKKF
jgi:hypothetical protein